MLIEKNVPMPERAYPRSTWNWHLYEVGDSCLLGTAENAARARNAASAHSRRYPGVKFTIRETAEGYRIWRTA